MSRRRKRKAAGAEAFILPTALIGFGLYNLNPAILENFAWLLAKVAFIGVMGWLGWRLYQTTQNTPQKQTKPQPAPRSARKASTDSKDTPTQPRTPATVPSASEPLSWTLELLQSLEWKRFEILCEAYFKTKNLDARVTEIGPDGGVDIRLYEHNSDKLFALMQCKAWSGKVGIKPVRELYGVMAAEGITRGIFLCSGVFTDEAMKFSEGKDLRLISGPMLLNAILKLDSNQQRELSKIATHGDYQTPTCPNCDVKLVPRRGKKGEFWGCSSFPRCRYTARIKSKS